MTASLARSSNGLNILAQLCEGLALVALCGIALVQLWQVLARYVLNQSLAWSEPLSTLLLSILLSFAAASAVHSAKHFRFSWLLDKSPRALRMQLDRAIAALIAACCLALSIKAAQWAHDGLAIKQAGIAFPVGSYYLPLAIGMALAFVFALAAAWRGAKAEV
jgi:TRAP-type C4-dicarboxylate transport system permease small subunit